MKGIPVKGVKLTDAGKLEKSGPIYRSVSDRIKAKKSKRVRVCKRGSVA